MSTADPKKNGKKLSQEASLSGKPDARPSRSALGEALRANLKRRKQQARARQGDGSHGDARTAEFKDD